MKWKVLTLSLMILSFSGVLPAPGNPDRLRVTAPNRGHRQACVLNRLLGDFTKATIAEASAAESPPSDSDRSRSIRLAWNPSPDRSVAGYRIYYGIEPGKYIRTLRVKGRLTARAEVKNLEKGKTYYFAISAYDAAGHESHPSAEITNRPGAKRPGPAPGGADLNDSAARAGLLNAAKIPPKSVRKTPEGKIAPIR
jgi:hypothetical protein